MNGGTHWPAGRSCAAVITVNFDAEWTLLSRDASLAQADKTLSGQLYGAHRGVDRFLDTFAGHGVTANWFIPGQVVADHYRLVQRIASAGQVIGMRGHQLDRLDRLDMPGCNKAIDQAVREFQRANVSPAGFRLPSGEWPFGLVDVLADHQIGWSSSVYGDDQPFFLRSARGQRIVELPVSYATDDRQAFAWNLAPAIPSGHPRIASYRHTLMNWLAEIEGCRRFGTCLIFQLHPEITGTPGRIGIVDELLDALTSHNDIWLTTADAVASAWSTQHAANPKCHPAELFLTATSRTGY